MDKSREGITNEKILQLARLFAPRNNEAIAKVSEFSLINIEKINSLTASNISGVILDFDECVAPHHGEILKKNTDAIINMINQNIKIVIFSNMKASERYTPLIEAVREETSYELQIVTSKYAKPDPRGFEECLEELNLSEGEEAVMIGDNFVTDGGAIKAGLKFIKVAPIKTEGENFWKTIKRLPQTSSRSFYSGVSNVYDFVGSRLPLIDEDFLN